MDRFLDRETLLGTVLAFARNQIHPINQQRQKTDNLILLA